VIRSTVPPTGALMGASIFTASMVATVSPAALHAQGGENEEEAVPAKSGNGP